MLHRTHCPDCRVLLERVLDFQRGVLEVAGNPAVALPPTEAQWQAALGAAGVWFFRRLSGRRKGRSRAPSEIGSALCNLMAVVRAEAARLPAMLEAFDHDRAFHEHAGDAGFTFSFLTLDAQSQVALKAFLELFYTKLLASGFPAKVHGGKGKLDRAGLLASFEQANPWLEVCPACDGQKPSQLEQRSLADADHYLPKSQYPFLSIHPLNLVPTCLECNQRIKQARDPVDQHTDAPLAHTFLPYVAPAMESVDIEVTRGTAGVMALAITDQAGMPSRRVASLNRVFELEARWKDRLRQQIELVREDVARTGRILREAGASRDADRLRQVVGLQPGERNQRLGRRPFVALEASYRAFAVGDEDELDVLMSYFAAS